MKEYYLYILVRTDMDSLNDVGKAGAQIAHASGKFTVEMLTSKHHCDKQFKQWLGHRGFGTTIVLDGGDWSTIEETLIDINDSTYYPNDYVEDDTYPVKDGKVMYYVSIRTCGYVFAPKGYDKLKKFKLLKTR